MCLPTQLAPDGSNYSRGHSSYGGVAHDTAHFVRHKRAPFASVTPRPCEVTREGNTCYEGTSILTSTSRRHILNQHDII